LGLATLLGSFIVYYRENKNLVLTTFQLTFSLFLLETLRITFLFTPNPLVFIPALFFANICSGLITLNITSTWHHILHPEIRARSSGLLSIMSCIVTFAPFVGAWVYQSLGLPILILGFLLMKITGIFIFTGFYDSYIRGMYDPLQKTNQLVTACA
ncbi:MAG: hypothetical protein ACFFCQ_13145, partial [Promethearchaeota archaeon]